MGRGGGFFCALAILRDDAIAFISLFTHFVFPIQAFHTSSILFVPFESFRRKVRNSRRRKSFFFSKRSIKRKVNKRKIRPQAWSCVLHMSRLIDYQTGLAGQLGLEDSLTMGKKVGAAFSLYCVPNDKDTFIDCM